MIRTDRFFTLLVTATTTNDDYPTNRRLAAPLCLLDVGNAGLPAVAAVGG